MKKQQYGRTNKISFDDNYGLTEMVLKGKKNMEILPADDETISAIPDFKDPNGMDNYNFLNSWSPYGNGEDGYEMDYFMTVVQPYNDCLSEELITKYKLTDNKGRWDKRHTNIKYLPNNIAVRRQEIVRIQSLTEVDFKLWGIKGFKTKKDGKSVIKYGIRKNLAYWDTPCDAFKALNDYAASIWDENRYVWKLIFTNVRQITRGFFMY